MDGLDGLFTEAARRHPDAVAVRTDDESLTYRALDARSNRLAHVLRAAGVGPETRVGLLLERGTAVVTAVLAVHKAGGAHVPLDPTYPRARLAHMLDDARPAVIVSLARHVDIAAGPAAGTGGAALIALDDPDTAAAIAAAPETPLPPSAGPDNLSWIIYTSGSSGRPKGVAVERGGVAVLAAAERALAQPRTGDVVLGFFSPSFDASLWEWILALQSGATLRLMPPGGLLGDLTAFLAANRITLATLPPSVAATIADDAHLPDLRVLMVGAEACRPSLVRRWVDRCPLWNVYGPTETTVVVVVHHFTPADATADDLPIGRPLEGITAHVLGEDLRPVAAGEHGELCVGGPMVARGYHDRPAATAERFVPDPFADRPGARLYRTGDRVRVDADGSIVYRGRIDQQVKISGYRIELGEVEAALRARPGVRDAVVAAVPAGDALRLVGYVVGDDRLAEEARDGLAATLPQHMVPTVVVGLPALPVGPTGKVDRAALPPPPAGTAARHVPPATPTERTVAALWRELLAVERIGGTDDFFRLGGHSLLAGRLGARVLSTFGVELAMRDLYANPTLTAFAARIDRAGPTAEVTPLRRATRRTVRRAG